MTTDENEAGAELTTLNANIAKLESLSQRLVAALANKRPVDPSLRGPDQELFMKAATAYMSEMVNNPAKVIEHQVGYWGKMLKHYVEAQKVLTQGKLAAPPDQTPKDKRFSNPLWESHPYCNGFK